ncbi:MAG TPA: succinate dehydrogenase/fumarate reductase iron-sulfur subunit [Anaeromyxobacteraceae bacterium]|nr:succinate dehydrogenase/fumarate reductase iron-sulfur subunit [Anaeromyxobacteraceae bacterium]
MRLTLEIWRQKNADDAGRFVRYEMEDVDHHMSFLEMLDVLNQRLIAKGEEPVAFDSDCREGICGMCGFVINGQPHGSQPLTTVCQLHMRFFHDGEVLRLEPFRAKAFPIVKDLVINRSALDRIIMAGGYVNINAGGPRDANSLLIGKKEADRAMDAAACIGCGACVAACPNASASLFTGAKVSQLSLLPQGQPERKARALGMAEKHATEGFGSCTVIGECAEACPKGIQLEVIARMNKDYLAGTLTYREESAGSGSG